VVVQKKLIMKLKGMIVEIGLFEMPAHPPERSLFDGAQWDLQMVRWADEYDFDEAWIGEHYFEAWEPCPAPDLLIAQALMQTQRVRLGAGCHLLPCHHPMSLAYRVAFLDHLSKGRLMFGIGAGVGPADMRGFDMDNFPGQSREKMEEAIDIILGLWDPSKPFKFEGKYWNAERVDGEGHVHTHHIWPYQKPYPPMAIAGLTPRSPSLMLAGRHGFSPLSFDMNRDGLLQNWSAVEEGAALAGRTANRKDWRIVRTIVVADTDEEARAVATNGFLARFYTEFYLPSMKKIGALSLMKQDPSMADSDVTPEYLSRTNWLCGSPDTVVRGIQELHEGTGGFGTMIMLGMDYSDQPVAWRRSMELMGKVVRPRIADLR
jgi:alkanesulfonate monooxygenase SsuD/methylene tetrahydromethanopterin reductase-like flavin-dependent oxidoreductase (luciferase family)